MLGKHITLDILPSSKSIFSAKFPLLQQNKPVEGELQIVRKNGNIVWIWRKGFPLPDRAGKFAGALLYDRDITDRKLAESTLQRVNQKLNVLSQLTRQDLTTQIFVLNSYLEMAKTHATGQDGIIKNIESSERAVRSIKEIMEFTKDYQNMGEKPPKYQNVKLSFLFGLSHISIGEIQHSLETENLEIFADPLLEKAFQGMLENSVKHGGHVSHIRVSHTVTPDSVTIVFEDDGVGIPKEKKERIFLRGEGARASVRGLVFVREILDITGITIRETGEPGKGARFEMMVPKGAWRMTGNGV
jgi:signal transduction histidine kinase